MEEFSAVPPTAHHNVSARSCAALFLAGKALHLYTNSTQFVRMPEDLGKLTDQSFDETERECWM
jgi:hypothetical protein